MLHLADELHAHELDQRQRRIDTKRTHDDDSPPTPTEAGEEGTENDDTPGIHP